MKDFFKLKTFNQRLFQGVDQINWFDKTGLINLDEKFVTLNLDDTNRHHYDGYLIEVYNKKQGLIFRKKFYFKDYIEVKDISMEKICSFSYWDDKVETKHFTDAILEFLNFILNENNS